MAKTFSYTDMHDNTDAVAAAVIPLCNTDTDGIEDWISNASTGASMTAEQMASEWDKLNA